MKYLVVIASGLTDEAVAERDNLTPLQLADTPNLDRLAIEGRSGWVNTVPEKSAPGNDTALLSLLGFDPEKFGASPAAFMAKALDVDLQADEVPLCCDFIILQSSHNDMVMKDYSAGHLATEASKVLVAGLQEGIADPELAFYAGQGPHNLMVLKSPPFPGNLKAPHELIGEGIRQFMPSDDVYKDLVYIMNQAQILLHNHPFNKTRKREGNDTINSVWFWGDGASPNLPAFETEYGKKAGLVSANLEMQGMALSAGMHVEKVSGATGFMDTDYAGKVKSALGLLESQDVAFLQISAGEDASLHGNIEDKILSIEDFDSEVLGPILDHLEVNKDTRLLIVENLQSSVVLMKYKNTPVPYVAYPSNEEPDSVEAFTEESLQKGPGKFNEGPSLIKAFLNNTL